MIHGFYPRPRWPNERQFNPKTILAPRRLFFGFIVIGGRAQMRENEFGNPNVFSRMFSNILFYFSIIIQGDKDIFFVNRDINFRDWYGILPLRNDILHTHRLVTTIY